MSADIVVTASRVYTRHGRPPVEAIAVRDGTVVAAGTLADVRSQAPDAMVVDGEDGTVLPAFVDPHQHAFLVAIDPGTDVLHRRATSIDELLRVIGELASASGGTDPWIRLHGYEPLLLAEHRSPTAAELDVIVGDRPLHVVTRTYHESVVNSAGLAALGITRQAPDPPGGRIVKDRRGEPTGVLLESASFMAEEASRPADDGRWRDRLTAHAQRLLSLGIVAIGDAAVPAVCADDVVATMAAGGVWMKPLLTGARIDDPAIVSGRTAKVLADGGEFCHLCFTPRQVRTLMVAAFRAGLGPERDLARAVGGRTGYPRRVARGRWRTGISFPTESRLEQLMRSASQKQSALAIHAVGNGAVEAVLSSYEVALRRGDRVSTRVEHVMVADPDQARRLAEAGIPVVAQPGFLVTLGHEFTYAPMPAPLTFMPLRTLLDAGVDLAFSSDYPATPLSPWMGVAAAVARRDRLGQVIVEEQVVGVADALTAHTEAAVSVLGIEGGKLEVGSPADLIVVDRDPYACSVSSLADTKTLQTWRAGVRVWPTPVRPSID